MANADIEEKVLRYSLAQIDDSYSYKEAFSLTEEQKQILIELKGCQQSKKEHILEKYFAAIEFENLKNAYLEKLTKQYVKQLKECLNYSIELDSKDMLNFVKAERNLRKVDSEKKFDSELFLERYKNFFKKDFLS